MMKSVTTLFFTVALSVILAVSAWSVEVGEPLPDFALKIPDGQNLSPEGLRGKPALLVFWNTWCPNCREELPKIDRLVGELQEGDLAVYAVNTSINDSEAKARAYWQRAGYRFPTGFDHDFLLGEKFGILGVPTVFLVDARGVVRYKQPLLPRDIAERIRQATPKGPPNANGPMPLAGAGDPASRSRQIP